MRSWWRSLWLRLGVALLAAAGAVVWLDRSLQHRETAAAARSSRVGSSAGTAPERRALPLAPIGGPILLATSGAVLARRIAPVLEIRPDGRLVLRRPEPAASWLRSRLVRCAASAAILLPGPRLRELDPAVRGALGEVIAGLVPIRPVPPGRFQALDLAVPLGDLVAVLGWVP